MSEDPADYTDELEQFAEGRQTSSCGGYRLVFGLRSPIRWYSARPIPLTRPLPLPRFRGREDEDLRLPKEVS